MEISMHHLRTYSILMAVVLFSLISMSLGKGRKDKESAKGWFSKTTTIAPTKWFNLVTHKGSESYADDNINKEWFELLTVTPDGSETSTDDVNHETMTMKGTSALQQKTNFARRRRGGETKIAPAEWFELLVPEGSESSVDDVDNETMVMNGTSLLDLQSTTHDSSHCKNGGIGFLGSFCICSDEYTGQYCEKIIKGSCDVIPHDGEWTYLDCCICRCVDGHLECTPHHLDGCEEREVERQRQLEEKNNCQTRQRPQILVFYIALLIAISWTNILYRLDSIR
ncbi:uncharacterized protein [Amphiura filiformis]|uniref:uncharacterized protein n=1 Tax=Amphiura filiformis TaxID=82378 RepID=UPI003B2208F3